MMRIFFIGLCFIAGMLSATAQQAITLEDIWYKQTYQPAVPEAIHFLSDGRRYVQREGSALNVYELPGGQKTATLFDAATAETDAFNWDGSFDDYSLSTDGNKILLAAHSEKRYRYSTLKDYYVADLTAKTLTKLYEGAKQRDAAFSPDGEMVAFVAINDLFIKDLKTGITYRVSADGAPNAAINGAPDWLYEEEFDLRRAFEWSPDSRKLAYLRFDETEVPEYTLEQYKGEAVPELIRYKYPKVGEKNPTASAWIYDLEQRERIPVKAQAEYLPRLRWTPGGALCITMLNRRQNALTLLLINPETGQSRTLLHETSNAYVELTEPYFLSDGSGFIWSSEKSGFRHLYLHDSTGVEKLALTKGKFDITAFYGVDPSGTLFYQAAAKSPMRREIYTVNLKGKKRKTLAAGEGCLEAQFAPDFKHFVSTFSNINMPPRYALRNRKGEELRVLEDNSPLKQIQQERAVHPIQFMQIPLQNAPAPNGQSWSGTLNAWLLRPAGPAYEGKKLPLLMFVYGGPGSQQVLDNWRGDRFWWFQMLAQQGYAVACVDNRGTGARGEAFKKTTYLQLGKFETLDQVAAARYFGTLEFVDSTRIGIFGWSYGGYMASLCMMNGEQVFKAGIAVAPVTHWKYYDSAYTERYMRTEEENPEGFAESAPLQYADQLKGAYLLVHGLADDNVHFQHSVEMSNRLVSARKPFDTMFYPNRDHSIADKEARLHLYTLMTRFLEKQL
jgi:dipeptidyl-peptidase-4